MFHKGVRLISPSHMLLCCTVSVRQKGTTDSQHTLMEEMSACVHLIHACTHAHTHTNLHSGGDVGERKAFEVGQQTLREHRRLWCVGGCRRN